MADTKKKSLTLFTHWARPRVRTYEYNYEYSESYYRPLVQYISTSRALASSSSSSLNLETRRQRLERRRRAASPPGALSFIERWTNEPFYGYGIGFRSRAYRASSEQLSSSSLGMRSSSLQSSSNISRREVSRRAQSVSLEQQQSSMNSSSLSSTEMRSRRARSVDIASRYASDDCLMRSTALNSASNAISVRALSASRDIAAIASRASSATRDLCTSASATISARALSATRDIMNTSSLTSRTLHLDNQNVLHGRALHERYYTDYPKQHLVCPENCPLHNSPEWRRRFLIGNRFIDAAALGGFDVLYDPSVYSNSRRLLAKLAERSEYETDEISIERNYESEASRRRVRASVA